VPAASSLVVELADAAARRAREALGAFLISAAAGVPEEVCEALGIGALPAGAAAPASKRQKRGGGGGGGMGDDEAQDAAGRPDGDEDDGDEDDDEALDDELLAAALGAPPPLAAAGGEGRGAESSGEGGPINGEAGSRQSLDGGELGQEQKGKGKGKGKRQGGRDGDEEGRGFGRSAGEVGDVLEALPSRLTGEEDRDFSGLQQQKREKAFKTRVFDLDDVRKHTRKANLQPIPDRSQQTDDQERRSEVGRWGEQFVHSYLRDKFENASGGDAGKRVVWVNEHEETGFQYDLRIENEASGEVEAYVEVKTTAAKDKCFFEMSYREWTFAQKEGNRYVIFRVSNAGKSDVELCSITNPFRQWKDLNLGMCLSL